MLVSSIGEVLSTRHRETPRERVVLIDKIVYTVMYLHGPDFECPVCVVHCSLVTQLLFACAVIQTLKLNTSS